MMPLKYTPFLLTPNEEAKRKAAQKQMNDLIARLSEGTKKYLSLTASDRTLLESERYAQDLIDNIIYLTIRNDEDLLSNKKDKITLGFSYDAFDPSIYANQSVKQNLTQISHGRCMYCESQVLHTGGYCIDLFRPPWGVTNGKISYRKNYIPLAYEHNNAIFSCKVCSQQYKGTQFPVIGKRFPDVEISQEKNLLIHPVMDNPRDFIRFNPLNAHAYARDTINRFYLEWKSLSSEEVDSLAAENPRAIPEQQDQNGNSLSEEDVNKAYQDWKAKPDKIGVLNRGEETIKTLGLNRNSLVERRYLHTQYMLSIWQAAQNNNDNNTLNDYLIQAENGTEENIEYRSLTMDLISHWRKVSPNDTTILPSSKKETNKEENPEEQEKDSKEDLIKTVPASISTSLIYIILESELTVKNKRRIVYLTATDNLYGELTEKAVFVEIDWINDINNPLKVRSGNHIWEASFAELIATPTVSITKLFSENEIWAEGNYAPLLDS